MSRLDSVIRLRKWELDEVRLVLTTIEAERDEILTAMDRLEQEYQIECTGKSSAEAAVTLGAYMQAVKQKRTEFQEMLEAKMLEVTEKQDELNLAYNELKKFEVARERQVAEEAAELGRKEQAEADEIGRQKFFRKN